MSLWKTCANVYFLFINPIFIIMKEKKNMYESPEITVVKLSTSCAILQGSQVDMNNQIDPWDNGGNTDDEISF